MPTSRYKLVLFIQKIVVLQRINNGGSFFYAQFTHLIVTIVYMLCSFYHPQVILKSMFLRFKLQTYFEISVSFSYICLINSKLSWAQTEIKLCLMLRDNCGFVDSVHWTAVAPFKNIFAATSTNALTLIWFVFIEIVLVVRFNDFL